MEHDGERRPPPRNDSPATPADAPNARPASLTAREREILALLADGLSGARIAERLVLSPETVRTHIRNAMTKLGASTRSQAVAIALRDERIVGNRGGAVRALAPVAGSDAAADAAAGLEKLVQGLVSLFDLDAGAVYLADDDGLALRRTATSTPTEPSLPESVALGHGPLGRTALERRAQLVHGAGGGAVLAAPIQADGRLLGVIALGARISRPIGRTELLLLQALSNRIGEVLLAGDDVETRLEHAMNRFRSSWSAATQPA